MSMQGVSELKNVLAKMVQDNSNGELSMREKGESGTLKSVRLTGLDASGITLKGDEAKIKFFRKDCASCVCDYIVLTTIRNQKVAVFIELKSTIPEADYQAEHPTIQPDGKYEHYVLQLSGGSCLFSYLDNVIELFLGCEDLRGYQRRFVVLYEKVCTNRPLVSMPIAPTRFVNRLPASNPATKAKMVQVHNGSIISIDQLV